MSRKNIVILLCLLCWSIVGVMQAQNALQHPVTPERATIIQAKIDSEKIAYLTQQMQLSSEEAAKFWPLYSAYRREMAQLRAREKQLMKFVSGTSEAELTHQLDALISVKKQRAALREQHLQQCRAILPAEKVLRYLIAEDNYKKHLLKDMNVNVLSGCKKIK